MRVLVALASGPFVGPGAAFVLVVVLYQPLRMAPEWTPRLRRAVAVGVPIAAGLRSFAASMRRDGKRFRLW